MFIKKKAHLKPIKYGLLPFVCVFQGLKQRKFPDVIRTDRQTDRQRDRKLTTITLSCMRTEG